MLNSEGNSSMGHTAVTTTLVLLHPLHSGLAAALPHTTGAAQGQSHPPAPDPDQAQLNTHRELAGAFPSSQEIHACKQTIFSSPPKQGKLESKNHFVSVTFTVMCISICKTNKTLSGNSEKMDDIFAETITT